MLAIIVSLVACGAGKEQEQSPGNEQAQGLEEAVLEFSAFDLEGNSVTGEAFREAKVIMVNFSEPWCGPCVREMPELEKLYQNYKDSGLVILGVFYSLDYAEDAGRVLKDSGVTYPIIAGNDIFEPYTTEYVPTTVFFYEGGRSEALIGARDYETWEKELLKYLK